MKKSMLLTTIAMIVVVVVALSTATFAWFSSFIEVTATATLTVEAGSAGIELRENTTRINDDPTTADPAIESKAGAWSEWTNVATPITAQAITAVAPTVDIALPTYAEGADSASLPNNDSTVFYSAIKKNDSGMKVVVNDGVVAAANTAYLYQELQIRTTSTTAQNVTATITITAKDKNKEADQLAVQNAKVVMVGVRGQSKTPTTTYKKGTTFNWGLKTAGGDTWDAPMTVPLADAEGQESTLLAANAGVTSDFATNYTLSVTDSFTGMTSASADWITVRIYVWIDGHNADNSVKGGAFDVSIKFTKAA